MAVDVAKANAYLAARERVDRVIAAKAVAYLAVVPDPNTVRLAKATAYLAAQPMSAAPPVRPYVFAALIG